MSSIDNLEIFEDRLNRLENLVGNFDKIDQTKGYETINTLLSKLSNYASSYSKIGSAFKSLNDIKRFTAFDALNEIEDETMFKAKIEIILSEEETLRQLDRDFQKLDSLSKILDNPALNDIPKLSENLKNLCSKQASIKENEEKLKEELKNFLSVYYTSMKAINESLINFDDYLKQYEPNQD